MTLSFVVLIYFLAWNFRNTICCPPGYIWCIDEITNGNCLASGIIAYGANTRYTYQTSSGSIYCGNSVFGDSVYLIQKECCTQNPALTGAVSPIVGIISCEQTVYSFFNTPNDIHYWKLTTTNFNDITYSLCNSSFNTLTTVHNDEGAILSLPYCPVNAGREGDDCNESACTSINNNEYFTIPDQLPGTYYIQILSYGNVTDHGDYQLSISCAQNEFNFDAIGCWADDRDRAMSTKLSGSYTISECQSACMKYKYFAMEYSSQCFCDNSFSNSTQYGRSRNCGSCTNPDINCAMPGTGGTWAFALYHNQFELILDHKNIADGYFSTNLKTTGLENENDANANTYSIIGNIVGATRANYLGSDSKYTFKLIYRYADGSEDELNWKQTSWITDPSIVGADLFDIPAETSCAECNFEGLGLSTAAETYLDGDGSAHPYWYQSVGSNVEWSTGIPAFNEKIAYSESLYILNPVIHTLDPTRTPTMEPTTEPTRAPSTTTPPTLAPSYNPTLSPSVGPSVVPTVVPSAGPSVVPSVVPSVGPTPSPTSQSISVGGEPTSSPIKTQTVETTATSVVDDADEGIDRKQNASGGIFGYSIAILILILALIWIVLLCCCGCLLFFRMRINKRRTSDFMVNGINLSDVGIVSGTGTGAEAMNAKTVEMEPNGYGQDDRTRVHSTSTISDSAPASITATPYQIPMQTPVATLTGGGAVTLMNTNNAPQQSIGIGMAVVTPDNNNKANVENNEAGEYSSEDEEDDSNELYADPDDDNNQQRYDNIFQTAGGPHTAGQQSI